MYSMGTNVYAIRKNPRELVDWKKAEIAVNNKDPWSLEEVLSEFNATDYRSGQNKNRVHLGKRSAGWKFLFDYQEWKYYDHTKESIQKFLEGCFAIEDEYGTQVSIEGFWKDFAEWNPKGIDGEGYYRQEISKHGSGSYASRDALQHDFYESRESPAGPIPKDLPYRFSNDTNFS